MIQPARADEAAWVAETVDAAFAVYIERMDGEPAPMNADHAASIEAGEVHILERAGERLGLVVQRAKPDHLFIDILAVRPSAQHCGAGRELLRFASACRHGGSTPTPR
jgi:ribosomal protein S18 acetylase RimI-like enzyme